MSEESLHQLIEQTETLRLDEQLRLSSHLKKLIYQRDPSEIISDRWVKILAHREEILKLAEKYGASNVRVFVDLERQEKNNPLREVSFLVNLESSRSLLDQSGLMCDLQELLGYEVYVIEEGGLKGEDREHILQEAIPL